MSNGLTGIVKVWEAKLKKSRVTARRRTNSIFSAMSVAHVDDDDDMHDDNGLPHVDKSFPNHDTYSGQWSDNWPHGHGTCSWADGCIYEGDWHHGWMMGRGKFTWPSGASYEGGFKNSYMEGSGVFVGSSNERYNGTWQSGLRHGRGICDYANGDKYEGHWRRGLPDGKGKYSWINGNQYVGHWRRGRMNGNGTMVWANGNRYDGGWEAGLPRGNGTFRWVDGSCYVGVWSKDQSEQSGTYYPSSSRSGSFDWDPQEVYLENLSDCRIHPGEEISDHPSLKILNWPCDGEDMLKNLAGKNLRASSVDGGGLSNAGSEYSFNGSSACCESVRDLGGGSPGLGRAEDLDMLPKGSGRPHIVIKPPTKKQGNTISKGHKNYDLMLNLQLGIR